MVQPLWPVLMGVSVALSLHVQVCKCRFEIATGRAPTALEFEVAIHHGIHFTKILTQYVRYAT